MPQQRTAAYIEHMAEIRQLSSPSLVGLSDADSYGSLLVHNFTRIGELAMHNRLLLERDLHPLLRSDEPLSDEKARELTMFCDQLIDASYAESLDAPLVELVSRRLLNDAAAKGDDARLIERLDTQIVACYTLQSMSMRITCAPHIANGFRMAGLEAARRLLEFLDKPTFERLDNASRELVLTNARYCTVLFESTVPTPELNEESLDLLDRALALMDDEFYRSSVPDFDWDYYLLRTLEYYAMSTDVLNVRAFTPEQLERIARRSEQLDALWHHNAERYSAYISASEVQIACARNRYLSGRTSLKTYQDELLHIFNARDRESFSTIGAYASLLAPLEYLLTLDPKHLTERHKATIGAMYEDLCNYAVGISTENCLGFVLEYFSLILENFIEIPGGITFEEMGMRCLAALHPPTYTHSIMVGLITRCLTQHLVRTRPELLVGTCGCATPQEVSEHEYAIVSFAYRAAVCHDFGKLPLIDTILMYGRNLVDFEFSLIQQHPNMGARILGNHESTREYAEVARLHHRWHDQSRGYPAGDDRDHPLQTIIDIVACADCMDAATDPVGRSYRKGKDLDEYLEEVREGAGTRYADFLPELMERPEVREDLLYLLNEGRSANYRNAYLLLRGVTNVSLH